MSFRHLLLALGALSWGCATTHVTRRDGCWVRQTETFPKTIHEEIGPCARAEPRWSEDRVARLVQECMAEADYRWQNEALVAWNQGRAMPPPLSEQTVMRTCMDAAATTVVSENEALRKRLGEVLGERDALRASAQQSLERLQSSQDRMTDALGEAAKKPAPAAFATSTSSGTTSADSHSADSQAFQPTPWPGAVQPAPPPVVPAPPPACVPPQPGKKATPGNCTPPADAPPRR
jgi:hypothetical protein